MEADGGQRLNRNVVNGSAELVEILGGLPPGTPVAFEAAYGWTWLVELLDDFQLEALYRARTARTRCELAFSDCPARARAWLFACCT